MAPRAIALGWLSYGIRAKLSSRKRRADCVSDSSTFWRCPVVSTTLGAQGLDLPPEESILLADEPQSFADALIRVLRDSDLRQHLEVNGLKVVQENYRWEQLGQKLTTYMKSI